MIREMASDVAELFSHLPAIRKKILEPGQPMSMGGSMTGSRVGHFRIDESATMSLVGGTNPRWSYEGTVTEIDTDTGARTLVSGATAVVLFNDAEDADDYMHGQDLEPNGVTLTPIAMTGVVMASYTGQVTTGGVEVWSFDQMNPMSVECP